MAEIQPRFEFRTWGRDLSTIERNVHCCSECERPRECDEVYIVSADNDMNNTKIRCSLMDIKELVDQREGLEQWNPRMKGEFPLPTNTLGEVFSAFGVELPELERDEYTLDQFLDELVVPHGRLRMVEVHKQRFAHSVNGCIAEIAAVTIAGEMLRTVAVESVDVPAILDAKAMLDLEPYENVNYPRAIKRVIGMEAPPGGLGGDIAHIN